MGCRMYISSNFITGMYMCVYVPSYCLVLETMVLE